MLILFYFDKILNEGRTPPKLFNNEEIIALALPVSEIWPLGAIFNHFVNVSSPVSFIKIGREGPGPRKVPCQFDFHRSKTRDNSLN
jgi:hypothetical protein